VRVPLLNPVTALFGPIFQKEVRVSGRRRGTYALRFLYTLGLLGLVSIAFWGARTSASMMSNVQRIQELQELAPAMTMAAMWFQFLALALIGPMLAAPTISDERRARSLSTLLTTPLKASEIILGKTSSRLVQIVILALLSVPVLLAIRIFGGLEPGIVLAYTCVSLSVAALGATLGVLYSIWHRRATSAALFAVLTMVLFQGGPTAIEGILWYLFNENYYGTIDYQFHEQVLATAAPFALIGLTETLMEGRGVPDLTIESKTLYDLLAPLGLVSRANAVGVVNLGPIWAVNCLYNLFVAGGISAVSVVALRRVMRKDGGEAAHFARPRRRRKARKAVQPRLDAAREMDSSGDEAIHERSKSREISDHPVLWRELRRASIASPHLRLAVVVITILGVAVLYWRVGIEEYGLHMTIGVLGALAVMVQSAFMTTGGISAEREGRTWEVLLTTPLAGREIILGKFLGSLRSQWFIPAVALAHFVIAAFAGVMPWYFIPQYAIILLGPTLFLSATGQFLSLFFRKGIVGAVLNLVLGLALWVGIWIILGLISWFGDLLNTAFWEDLQKLPYSLNPALMAGSACDALADNARSPLRAQSYEMFDEHLKFAEFLAWMIGAFLFYTIGAAAVLSATIARFQRLSGRSS
jgi:ABC-type transport system involved in multi-copper enzyme maturation permease subunit